MLTKVFHARSLLNEFKIKLMSLTALYVINYDNLLRKNAVHSFSQIVNVNITTKQLHVYIIL